MRRARAHSRTAAALGVGLSLDDFETGQTSLAYLRKLSLDEIKIDRSFVLELGRDEAAMRRLGSSAASWSRASS